MAEDKEYPLTRDFVDFNRLNLQHNLWRDIFGYVLHPKVPHEGKNLKVADVGTGTGVWLLELTSHLSPSTEFLGLDTDVSQAGPREFLPPKVSMRQWDVFTDVPDDLVGQFDIVNLRLFGFVIRGDSKPVLRKLIKLLKPGGYLQWSEADVESWHVKTVSGRDDIPTDNLRALWRVAVPEGSRLLPTWVKALPQAFEEEGLLDVEADWQEGKPHTTLAMHWCNLHLYPMIASKVRPTNPAKATEIEDLLERAIGESRNGAMFAFNRVNVVGKRSER